MSNLHLSGPALQSFCGINSKIFFFPDFLSKENESNRKKFFSFNTSTHFPEKSLLPQFVFHFVNTSKTRSVTHFLKENRRNNRSKDYHFSINLNNPFSFHSDVPGLFP